MATRYISIREFSDFHGVDYRIVEEFIDYGLVEPDDHEREPALRESDLPHLEAALRLHRELGINVPGVCTILHLQSKISSMQKRMREMETQLRYLEQFRR